MIIEFDLISSISWWLNSNSVGIMIGNMQIRTSKSDQLLWVNSVNVYDNWIQFCKIFDGMTLKIWGYPVECGN